jgi:hydrogenase-4 component E
MQITPQFLFFIEVLIFMSVIFMHISKKNSSLVVLYAAQSIFVAGMLMLLSLKDSNWQLMAVALVMFAIKVIVAPRFFSNLIKKYQLKFSVSSYLNMPMTLVGLIIFTGITHTRFFEPVASIVPAASGNTLLLSVAVILISLFLIVNKRGALSQMIGILSLENGIVSFASVAGLEQTPILQLGIIFDIFIWVVIATVFASMIYSQFGTLDVTKMKHLKED